MIKGVSPDGKWLWEIREQVGSGLSITRILDQDGIEKHRIFFQQTDFPDQEFIEASYSPLFWLPNEPYVYFVGSHCCFDGSIYYHNGFKLSRLNLETGEFTTQVAGSPSQMDSYYFSFSPTGRFFLATSTSPFELKITQLFDMAEKIIQLPKSIEQAGDAIWSQDGRRVILTACEEQVERDCTHFPALVVNVLDGSYKILIPDVGEPVHDVKVVWINDSQAVVTNNDGQKWQIDVDMGIVQEEKP